MYHLRDIEDKKGTILKAVKDFNWSRGLPGGWLTYGPPRKVTAYGDGSLYTDEGKKHGQCWKKTAWSASVPYSNSTAVTKTQAIPSSFLRTGILKNVRDALREYGASAGDHSCTGLWCNYYDKPTDMISAHKDDENYYERNYENQPLFVSLTLYEDQSTQIKDLARFQIKKGDKWHDVNLPHLSLLVMSGGVEHRVLKPRGGKFRKRFNITFRTPIKREDDIIKNFRFFSNFGRYYLPTFMLYVPANVFVDKMPKPGAILPYNSQNNICSYRNKIYKIIKDDSNFYKVIREHSRMAKICLSLNCDLDRDTLLENIYKKYGSAQRPPNTSTNHALYVLINN